MTAPNFVNTSTIESLEDYAASILTSMYSLKALENYHLVTLKKGLLDNDETELAKSICWEIQRLLNMYKTQMSQVLKRAPIDQKAVIKTLQKLIPEDQIPKPKRRVKKEKDDGKNCD